MSYIIDPHDDSDHFYECDHCGKAPSEPPTYNDMKVACEHCGQSYHARKIRLRYAIHSTFDAPGNADTGMCNDPCGWLCKEHYCKCGDDAKQLFIRGFVNKCENCHGLWYKRKLVWVWSGGVAGSAPYGAHRFKRLGDANRALKTGETKRAMRQKDSPRGAPGWPHQPTYYGYTVRIVLLREKGHRLYDGTCWRVEKQTVVWPEPPVLDRLAAI